MSVTEDLSVAYHQQDTNYYCGAACAQMVLDSVGSGLLGQDGLYSDNHSHSVIEAGWYSAPDGMQWTMNNGLPAGSSRYFALDALASEDALSRMLVWTVHHWQVAPIALVFGSQHWIVVRGYDASAAPSSSIDTSYTIDGFYVNNPWPPTPSPGPPPPHGTADGCGGGSNRGVADEHISYSTWQSTYMTGATGGHWNGQFVAVCDPDPVPQAGGARAKAPERASGEVLLSSGEAMERAGYVLQRAAVAHQAAWKRTIAKVSASEPWLVQQLDRDDQFSWIVPMAGRDGRLRIGVRIDARTGLYQQAIHLPQGELIRPTTETAQRLIGTTVDLPEPLGRLRLRPEAVCVYPRLVWKPCRESLSPFYPFWMITAGAYHIYIRVDGTVFTALRDELRGI